MTEPLIFDGTFSNIRNEIAIGWNVDDDARSGVDFHPVFTQNIAGWIVCNWKDIYRVPSDRIRFGRLDGLLHTMQIANFC